MSSKPQFVSLTIMGKEYKVACEPEEQESLIRSADELNAQMCKMRDSGKIGSPERIAVIAALNLSHELRTIQKHSPVVVSQNWKDCMGRMMAKIENILEKR